MSHLDRKPTLVMGARGSVGKFVLDALLEQGVPVRASARKPEPGQFPAGVEVFAADLTDQASLAVAFDGVGQVFLYANHEGVDGVIDAARDAGVERIVLMSSGSVIHPTSAGNAITEAHRQIEDAFDAASDLTVVPIRPLVLATNALGWAWPIKASASVALYEPDAVTAPIHEKDIAAVAVAALTGNTSAAVSELLTGTARISQRDQVAAIAAATGKDITVTELTRDEAAAQFARFMPAEEAEAVLQFLDDADAGNSPATDTVSRVLGRPALGFDVWAADHAAEF
ncbi:NAD(P)H-binding protein [Curtobacterium flaccumfaciens]|nr:NAD(P)H-binding protein [Curtobacterium flaccumfaciens]WFR67690.1 NAD(P)H-binding protein [Curtobacterium flaccumfaciens]